MSFKNTTTKSVKCYYCSMDIIRKTFIILNLFIFITMVIAVVSTLTIGSRATRLDDSVTTEVVSFEDGAHNGVELEHWQHIVTFTILSNVFLGIIALISAIIALRHPRKELPQKLSAWYLIAASSTMLTCLTVIFFLAPMRAIGGKNYFDMLLEQMFFLHFLNPILGAICYIFFFETKEKISFKPCLLAILPPVIYSTPYIFYVCIIKSWPDFYGLTFGGRYYVIPFVYLIFCSVMFVISTSLAAFHNHVFKTK